MKKTTVENAISRKKEINENSTVKECKLAENNYNAVLRKLVKEISDYADNVIKQEKDNGVIYPHDFNTKVVRLNKLKSKGYVEVEYYVDTYGYGDFGAYSISSTPFGSTYKKQ